MHCSVGSTTQIHLLFSPWRLYLFIQCILLCVHLHTYIYLQILNVSAVDRKVCLLLFSFSFLVILLRAETRVDQRKSKWNEMITFFMQLDFWKLRASEHNGKYFKGIMILFACLYIIKQIVYRPVRDSIISFALTVMFIHQREVFLFSAHNGKKKKQIWMFGFKFGSGCETGPT